MKNLVYITLLFLMNAISTFAQPKSANIKLADHAYYEGNFYRAIELYQKELEKNSTNPHAVLQLAYSYQKIGNFKEAHLWFEKLFYLNHKDFQLAEFYYASSFKTQENYAAAKEHFEHFRKNYRGNNQSYYTSKAKDEMKICDVAETMPIKTNVAIIPLKSNINKRYSELSPTLYRDSSLVFSTVVSDTLLQIDVEENNPTVKLYIANLNDTNAKIHEFLPELFAGFSGDIVDVTFSNDEKKMVFTECKKNQDNKIICQLYASMFNNNVWQAPILLGSLANEPGNLYTSMHPTLTYDHKSKKHFIYFVSDKPGGIGGLDLWYAEIDDNLLLSNCYNMGRKFNSTEDEITPFIEPLTGNLYYSSNGFESIGGYDIFLAANKGKSFDKPKNSGKPFNTGKDEFYFKTNQNNKGYFVSNRTDIKKNNCCDDIYHFYPEPKKYLRFNVYDSLNHKTENASITLTYNNDSLTFHENTFYAVKPNDSIQIEITKQGFLKFSTNYFANNFANDSNEIPIQLTPIQMNIEYRLNNIYFDYNKATPTNESSKELNQLYSFLVDNPLLIVEISAHTDNKGNAEYNLNLSEERAKSVMNYMLLKGVNPKRLKAKGYGMTQPIAPNTLPNGSDNAEGRQQNRRTVFKVIGQINP